MPAFDMDWGRIAGVALGATVTSYLLGFAVRRLLLGLQIVDRPNQRSSHEVPTLRGGGIGIMLVVCGGMACLAGGTDTVFAVLGVATLVLAVVSLVDDRYSISWRVRMSIQIAAAVAGVAILGATDPNAIPRIVLVGAPMFVFWIAGYANAFNFMDGINGIAGSQAVFTGVGTAFVGMVAGLASNHAAIVLSILVAGAAAGFLPHNFPRAKVFMGDVGSVPLGYLLAVLAVWVARDRGWWLLVPLLGLHMNFILDTAITLFRRWRRGDVLHLAHREHFYQRLVRSGRSHLVVTGWEGGLQVPALALAVAVTNAGPAAKLGALAATMTIWVVFFIVCERELVARRQGS